MIGKRASTLRRTYIVCLVFNYFVKESYPFLRAQLVYQSFQECLHLDFGRLRWAFFFTFLNRSWKSDVTEVQNRWRKLLSELPPTLRLFFQLFPQFQALLFYKKKKSFSYLFVLQTFNQNFALQRLVVLLSFQDGFFHIPSVQYVILSLHSIQSKLLTGLLTLTK